MKRITVTDFRGYARDRFIDAQTGPEAKLAPTVLLTNEMGVEGGIREELTPDRWSRVVFDLPSAKVGRAELLFYVHADTTTQQKPMCLFVNGHRLGHRQNRERMLTGGWDRKGIPVRHLKPGPNEFIFAGSGVLYVDPGPEGKSSRSFNRGETWHADALGPERNVRGDYLVRLRLGGHPPEGVLTSPVIDLADPSGGGRIAPRTDFRRVRLAARQRAPAGTRIRFEMRSGSTPEFDPRCWTPWQWSTSLSSPGRFVQWRATLSTDSADKTPVLSRVTLHVDATEDKASLKGIKLSELDHPELPRSSYGFSYLAPHPRVTRLLKQYRLEQVVAPGGTELEKLALLRDWVHSQWLGWQGSRYPYCPPWDAIEILETTKGNWGYGMCTHYAAVFVACAAALGYASRSVIIDHHCLAEVWSEELQKWILEDAGPARDHDATYELKDEVLNALEIHQAVARGDARKLRANKLPQDVVEPMGTVSECFCRFGIPLRNDHLVAAEPAELRHGQQQYHWDGYLWWSDDIDPRYPEYSLQSTRPADFYWPVNQTRIYLQATEEPNVLQVDLETVTPNFARYLVQVDGGEWEERTAPFRWSLHAGPNALAVRSVNAFGKEGRLSRAAVDLAAEPKR